MENIIISKMFSVERIILSKKLSTNWWWKHFVDLNNELRNKLIIKNGLIHLCQSEKKLISF